MSTEVSGIYDGNFILSYYFDKESNVTENQLGLLKVDLNNISQEIKKSTLGDGTDIQAGQKICMNQNFSYVEKTKNQNFIVQLNNNQSFQINRIYENNLAEVNINSRKTITINTSLLKACEQ